MAEKPKEQPDVKSIGFDNLIGDVFGLNIKGLKTIWTLFRHPEKYFKAAKTAEWENDYTPSFRVWFGIMAITTGLQFIWGSKTSPFYNAFLKQISAVPEQYKRGHSHGGKHDTSHITYEAFDADAITQIYLKWYFVFTPFMIIVCFALLALIFRAWGEKLTYVVRIRYLFASIVTGSFIGLVWALGSITVPQDHFMLINLAGTFLMFGAFIYTIYSGAFASVETGERIGRTIFTTFMLILFYIISIMAASILAMIVIMPEIIDTIVIGETVPHEPH